MSKIKILSFFTGGGFLDIGFEKVGFDTVWSNEFEKTFAEIYHYGMSSWAVSQDMKKIFEITNTNSVEELNVKTILKEAFNNNMPNIFGMIGGPPCQDFSINGNRNGFNGNRGKLTKIYIQLILNIKPPFFLMENVPGLVGLKSAKPIFNSLVTRLRKDYYVEKTRLNSIDFGVPQSRERIFVVGFLKQKIKNSDISFKWPKIEKYYNALKKYDWPKINKFGNLINKPKNIPYELCVESCLKRKGESLANINEFFKFRNSSKKRLSIDEGNTNRQSFKRLHRYRYSPTTSYGNNEVHMHPYKDRRISVRESLRIQGVPDTYVVPKSINLSQKFKVVSNGVPVPLAYNIALSIKEYIIKNII